MFDPTITSNVCKMWLQLPYNENGMPFDGMPFCLMNPIQSRIIFQSGLRRSFVYKNISIGKLVFFNSFQIRSNQQSEKQRKIDPKPSSSSNPDESKTEISPTTNLKTETEKSTMPPKQSSGVKWSSLTDEQKKEIHKMQNTENARRNRERWRKEDDEMVKIYEENERKIHQLEKQVGNLSSQLGQSSHSRKSKK